MRGEPSSNTVSPLWERKSEEEKCNDQILWVKDKGCEIYSTWELGAEEAKKLDTYYTKYEAYVKVQQEGESFEQFLSDLKSLVKKCGYADPNEMVRYRVVIGSHASKIRKKS